MDAPFTDDILNEDLGHVFGLFFKSNTEEREEYRYVKLTEQFFGREFSSIIFVKI